MRTNPFRLIMIGAMYENGGNTTHRFLDGHPQIATYPFESQLGTALVQDRLTSLFPVKYRWPVFSLSGTPTEDYRAIIDEECKVRARTPHVSKFRHAQFEFSDEDRLSIYCELVAKSGRSRAANVEAFFRATFTAWKNFASSGREECYLGYSPVLTVDAEKILNELPTAHFIHVVRNPWSAYADTKKRPVPLSLQDYTFAWGVNQYYALLLKEKFPERFHLVRIEDVMRDPKEILGGVCKRIGLESSDSLKEPTWNSQALPEVYPWGTIRRPTPEVNLSTAKELSAAEQSEVRERTALFLEPLDYKNFLS